MTFLDELEELREFFRRHRHHEHKPASLGLIFPYFNARSYSVNSVTTPIGQFSKGTFAYLTAAGLPALDSNGLPVPLVGPLIISDISDTVNLTAVVNSNDTVAVGVAATGADGTAYTFTLSDSSPTPITATITVTAGNAVAVGVPASLDGTWTGPFPTAPTS